MSILVVLGDWITIGMPAGRLKTVRTAGTVVQGLTVRCICLILMLSMSYGMWRLQITIHRKGYRKWVAAIQLL